MYKCTSAMLKGDGLQKVNTDANKRSHSSAKQPMHAVLYELSRVLQSYPCVQGGQCSCSSFVMRAVRMSASKLGNSMQAWVAMIVLLCFKLCTGGFQLFWPLDATGNMKATDTGSQCVHQASHIGKAHVSNLCCLHMHLCISGMNICMKACLASSSATYWKCVMSSPLQYGSSLILS